MRGEAKWNELFQRIEKVVQEWREENPVATLTEIEEAVDKELAVVRVKMVEDLALEGVGRNIKGLSWEERPKCPECEEPVRANGRGERRLTTSYEQQVKLERSKAYCPQCDLSFFPPR